MRLAAGVDLGGTNLRAALVAWDEGVLPELRAEARTTLGDARDPAVVADHIAALVADVSAGAGPVPVGVGVAAMLGPRPGVVVNAPNLGWRDVDLGALLAARLPGPARLENDLDAIAWGEAQAGAGLGARDLLCVFVGTGVGAGLVVNGALARGAAHVAGELGHVKVASGPGARPCGCGARGCLEAYAGGKNLNARALVERGQDLHAGHIDELCSGGDAWATALWDEVAAHLGGALANAVTLLDPERLILGGGVLGGAPELHHLTLTAYRERVNPAAGDACQVVTATLGDHAGVIGAALLAG